MKRSLKALAWAAACWLTPVQAQAQSFVETAAYRPAAQAASIFNTSGACADPGCAAVDPSCAADPSCGLGEAACGSAGGAGGCGNGACGNGCNSCGRRGGLFGCCTDDPWTLKSAPGFNYGGWVQVGWQDRADGAFTNNGPFLNQREHGNVNLNQLYTFVEKVADGTCGLDWGFRADVMYGVDGNEAQAFGNVDGGHWDYLNGFGGPNGIVPEPNQHGPYEFAAPQAYGQLALGKLSTKFGHFYTPIGYEVVTSPSNFFLSRQLTFYNSEPFTHTGFMSTYTVSDNFNFSGGWTAGWDSGFYTYNDGSALLGGFTWVVGDKLTINNYASAGQFGWRGDGYINSLVASLQWTERFSTVHQFDILETNGSVDAAGFPSGTGAPVARTSFQTNGVAGDSIGWINYAFYQLTDCVKLGSRLEWYKADGTSYQTFTNGVNFKLGSNMMIRPEARYMWSNDRTSLPGANLFSNGDRLVWGCDWIFTF